jgi:GTP-binding protein
MTNFEDYVSLRRFDRAWKFMGIDKLLKKNGIQEGDTVNLYGTEFTFSDNRNQEETEE